MDLRFYMFSFCRLGGGCSAALVTPESGDCTFHGWQKELSDDVFGSIKIALKRFCLLLKPVIPFYRHAVTSHLLYHLSVSFLYKLQLIISEYEKFVWSQP